MQPTNNDTAWDFSTVFSILNGISDVDSGSKSSEGDVASSSESQPLTAKNGITTSRLSKGLGDFSQIWDALGVQYDDAISAKPVFEASLASSRKNEDAYASDGALYYPPSSKSVQWRDEVHGEDLADTQPDTPPDSEARTAKSEKKKLKKQKKHERELEQMAATLMEKRKAKKLDPGSQSDANVPVATQQSQGPHATPTKKKKKKKKQSAQAHGSTNSSDEREIAPPTPAQTAGQRVVKNSKNDDVKKNTPTPGRYNLRPRQSDGTVANQTSHGTPTKAQLAGSAHSTPKKNTLLPPQITPQKSVEKPNNFPKEDVVISKKPNDTVSNLQKQLAQQYQSFPNDATPPRKPNNATGTNNKPLLLGNSIEMRDFSKPSAPKADLSCFPVIHTPAHAKHRHELKPREDLDAVQRNWNLLNKLMRNFPEDNATLLSPMQLSYNKQQPNGIHVFVDASNILIGFQQHLKRARGIHQHQHVPRVYPSFHALALLLERRRPIAKRVLAGSTPEIPEYERAREIGYETCILDKVYKARELTERKKFFAERDARARGGRGTGGGGGYTSGSGSDSATNGLSSSPGKDLYKPQPAWVEQAVDEILHLKILESIVDTPPVSKEDAPTTQRPTMVLGTGDAAEAEYSSGFLKMVERALNNGWNVEVMAWSSSVSLEYRRLEKKKRAQGRFKVVELDDYAEELFPTA